MTAGELREIFDRAHNDCDYVSKSHDGTRQSWDPLETLYWRLATDSYSKLAEIAREHDDT